MAARTRRPELLIVVALSVVVTAFAGSALAATHTLRPTVESFSPPSVKPLGTVVINGKQFTGTRTVRVDGVLAKFKLLSATKIIATVPSNAKSGKITVTSTAGTGTSTAILRIALPTRQPATATTVNVIAGKPSEFRFTLSTRTVKHGTVTFKLTDKGALPHTLKICTSPHGAAANNCAGKSTPTIPPGRSATLKVTFPTPGTYEYLCTLPGHAAAGMKGDLKVT